MKRRDIFKPGNLGYVKDERGVEQIHVYDGNVFFAKDNDPIIASYDNWLAMADDGWVVD